MQSSWELAKKHDQNTDDRRNQSQRRNPSDACSIPRSGPQLGVPQVQNPSLNKLQFPRTDAEMVSIFL
jgi:hypothetical protein